MATVHVKCTYRNELRRMHFASNLSFVGFMDMLQREYPFPITIYYENGSAQRLPLNQQQHYQAMIQMYLSFPQSQTKHPTLRLFIDDASLENTVAAALTPVEPKGIGKNFLNLKVSLLEESLGETTPREAQDEKPSIQPPSLIVKLPSPMPNVPDYDAKVHVFSGGLSEADVRLLGVVGSGASGVVRKGVRLKDNMQMAIKTMPLNISVDGQKQILIELHVLHQCQSPYIVGYYGAFFSRDVIFICTEWMDCSSLDTVCSITKTIPECILSYISLSVLRGLVYLYECMRVIHRDIKPSNILLNTRGNIRLCDFGVSAKLTNSLARTYVGTNAYMAPEKITGGEYTVRSDVWSLGLTLIELATGRFPYPANAPPELEPLQMGVFELLLAVVNEPAPRLSPDLHSPSCVDFAQHCLAKDQNARPTPQHLLEHPFVQPPVVASQDEVAIWAQRVQQAMSQSK